MKLNSALLALRHRGGGPVHINLTTTYSSDFSIRDLPCYRAIFRYTVEDSLPELMVTRVGVFVGAHLVWTPALTASVEQFCENYNGIVICDHTSNYHGKYRIQCNLLTAQKEHVLDIRSMELVIDMGEMSGAYMGLHPKEVWRVNPDGEVRDMFRTLTKLFDMSEQYFFDSMNAKAVSKKNTAFYAECRAEYNNIFERIPELPFSNIWMARQLSTQLPEQSIMHLGILNSLRSWNFFEISDTIDCYTNTGGFGIDGLVSTLLGASLGTPDKLHFIVLGDLAFFYDLNAIANRHVGDNLRILLINNGLGTEFRNYNHFAAQFGEDANQFMAAQGHYGRKSPCLVKHYAEDLGFKYLTANSKESFLKIASEFTSSDQTCQSILFEVFTSPEDESEALRLMNTIVIDPPTMTKRVKNLAKSVLGESGVKQIKKIVKR